MFKTYQKVTETKLFEFSRNTNMEELKDKTTSICNGFTWQGFALQWLHYTMARYMLLCNGYVPFEIAVSFAYAYKHSYHLS